LRLVIVALVGVVVGAGIVGGIWAWRSTESPAAAVTVTQAVTAASDAADVDDAERSEARQAAAALDAYCNRISAGTCSTTIVRRDEPRVWIIRVGTDSGAQCARVHLDFFAASDTRVVLPAGVELEGEC
jgi:hypothetical protein